MIEKQYLRLILQMFRTIEGLGGSPMARIDARLWAEHYRRKLVRNKIIKAKGKP